MIDADEEWVYTWQEVQSILEKKAQIKLSLLDSANYISSRGLNTYYKKDKSALVSVTPTMYN